MVTKQQLEKLGGWHYVQKNRDDDMFPISGWKLHIFGDTLDDSYAIASAIEPIIYNYNLCMKVATISVINAGIGIPTHNQYGKCVVVYLSPALFRENTLHSLIVSIQTVLKNAGYTKSGTIVGSKSIDGTIFYRYELSEPIDIKSGVDFWTYVALYEKNRGYAFNITGNPDIESYINS